MATSKKSSPSKRKPAGSKAVAAKAPDAIVADEGSELPKTETASAMSDDTTPAVEGDTVVAMGDDTIIPDPPEEAASPEEPVVEATVEPADEADAVGSEADDEHSKPNVAVLPAVIPAPAQPKSAFFPMLLGGVAAAALGYFAAQYGLLNDPTAALRSDLNAEKNRITALEAAKAPSVDLSPLQTQLAELDSRIKALEDRPAAVAPAGVDMEAIAAAATAAYAKELEGLRTSVESQRGEIQDLLDNAKTVEQATAEAAQRATAQTALAKIVSALDAGQPFTQPLADLKAVDVAEVDPALDDVAADGAATLNMLQAQFPEQARTALSVARASGEDAAGQQNLGSFLKRSLGARSVTPREGNDPDAILSRAEAALNSGDLNTALIELDTLPEDAQAAIADWRAAADAHLNARKATDALAQRLTAD